MTEKVYPVIGKESIEWCIDNCAGYIYHDKAQDELNALEGDIYRLTTERDSLLATMCEIEEMLSGDLPITNKVKKLAKSAIEDVTGK